MKGADAMCFDRKKAEKYFLIAAAVIGGCYFFSHYGRLLSSILLPFVIAGVCAHLLAPPAEYLSAHMKIPKWLSCVVLVLTFFAALFTLLYLTAARLFRELAGLSEYACRLGALLPRYLESARTFFSERLPFLGSGGAQTEIETFLFEGISELAASVAARAAGWLSTALPSVIAFVPNFLLAAAVTVLATCYFTADLKKIRRFFLCQLPERAKRFFSECSVQFFDTLSKYAGAYFTIACITFAELFAGLLLIRREYALILALVTTVIDILPFFGTGLVLLPWAAASLLLGESGDAAKLFLLYLVITIVRQIIEPRILGSFIGLHPLSTLFAVFAGAKLLGIAGMFLFPIAAIVLKNLNDKGVVTLFRAPPENTDEILSAARHKYRRYRKDV